MKLFTEKQVTLKVGSLFCIISKLRKILILLHWAKLSVLLLNL